MKLNRTTFRGCSNTRQPRAVHLKTSHYKQQEHLIQKKKNKTCRAHEESQNLLYTHGNTPQQSAFTPCLSIYTADVKTGLSRREGKESSKTLMKSPGQRESWQHSALSVLTDVRTREINKAKLQEPISFNIACNHYQEDIGTLQRLVKGQEANFPFA